MTLIDNLKAIARENNLPAPSGESGITTQIILDVPQDAEADYSLEELQKIDVVHANNMLKLMYAYIPQVKSISSLCRLSSSVMNVLAERRKLLCKQYGVESKRSGTGYLEPDD